MKTKFETVSLAAEKNIIHAFVAKMVASIDDQIARGHSDSYAGKDGLCTPILRDYSREELNTVRMFVRSFSNETVIDREKEKFVNELLDASESLAGWAQEQFDAGLDVKDVREMLRKAMGAR